MAMEVVAMAEATPAVWPHLLAMLEQLERLERLEQLMARTLVVEFWARSLAMKDGEFRLV